MPNAGDKAWFVRIGLLGWLMPVKWQGALFLVVSLPLFIFLGIISVRFHQAGDSSKLVISGTLLIIYSIVGYIFALSKSRKI